MRELAPNYKIRAYMAQYGISMKELTDQMGTGRSHTSVLMNKPLNKEHKAMVIKALKEIVENDN